MTSCDIQDLQQWLESLGKQIAVDELINLRELNLCNKQIKELPNSFGELSNLQWLDLSDNQISELPHSIGELSNLQSVLLYNNQIRELPESIGKLSKLEKLDLSNNQISKLPESIGFLKNLQGLVISDNQIRELPDSFSNLCNLSLYLDNKQICDIFGSINRSNNIRILCKQSDPINMEEKTMNYPETDDDFYEQAPNWLQQLYNICVRRSIPVSLGGMKNATSIEFLDKHLHVIDGTAYGCVCIVGTPYASCIPDLRYYAKDFEQMCNSYDVALKILSYVKY